MARTSFPLAVSRADATELQRRLAKATPWQRRRIRAVLTAAQGRHSFRGLARALGVSAGALGSWLKKFDAGGVEGLLRRRKPPGPKARVTDPKLKAQLAEQIRTGRLRTTQQVSFWFRTKGIRLAAKSVYRLLDDLGLRFADPNSMDAASPKQPPLSKGARREYSQLPLPAKRGRPKLAIRLPRATRAHLEQRLKEIKDTLQAYVLSLARAGLTGGSDESRRRENAFHRLRAISLVAVEGKSIVYAAGEIKRGTTTVHRWLSWFRTWGAGRPAVDALTECQPAMSFRNRSRNRN